MSAPRVVLFTKAGCHLCEEAEATVQRVCAALDVEVRLIDITTDPALVETYGEEVPVTVVDGRRHAVWRVDEARLRHALASAPA